MSIENKNEKEVTPSSPSVQGKIWRETLSGKEKEKRKDTLSKIKEKEREERKEDLANLPNINEAYETTSREALLTFLKAFKLLSKSEQQRFQEVLKWLKALYKTGTPLDLFSPLGIFYTSLTMQQKRREKNELINPKVIKPKINNWETLYIKESINPKVIKPEDAINTLILNFPNKSEIKSLPNKENWGKIIPINDLLTFIDSVDNTQNIA